MKNSKLSTFGMIFKALGSVPIIESKMYTVPLLWKGISPYLRKVISVVYGRTSLISDRVRSLNNFVLYLQSMNRHHGPDFTVKWLKACFVALQRYLGDNSVISLRDLEPDLPLPRVYGGIPAIIPRADRSRIKRGDTKTIQFWLTAFSIYRVMICSFNPKLSTISDPFSGSISYLEQLRKDISTSPILNRFRVLPGYDSWRDKRNICPSTVKFIQSSSPTNSVAWHGLILDAQVLSQSPVYAHFLNYLKAVNSRKFLEKFNEALDLGDRFLKKFSVPSGSVLRSKESWGGSLGQLAFKEEAAGKLRGFALVDIWTQSVLSPLHDELFRLLKIIPNDGTFDQNASVRRGIDKASLSSSAYSFDLSAATDRLPIDLQVSLINMLFGGSLGTHWKGLLVDRKYTIPEKSRKKYSIKEEFVTYTVGQPMGALSSWAMLAITHHFIVQLASLKIGRSGWETNYEILGDDLVIFDKALADSYLAIAKALGVEINMSKSIVSDKKPVFEFAKRMVIGTTNVSAISIKQFISEASVGSRVANILYFASLGLIRTNSVLSILLSRFGKFKSLKDLNLPLLSLLGALFNSKRVSLRDIITAMIDPNDEEFDFEESKFSLPTQSLLTATKGLLNATQSSLELPNRNDELFEELEADLTASVLLQALASAKKLENDYDRIVESFLSNTRYFTNDTGYLRLIDDPEACFSNSIETREMTHSVYEELLPMVFPSGICGGYAYKLFAYENPMVLAALLNDRIFVSSVDGWVLDLIMDGDDFDANDLVDEVESIAYNHAKYNNYPMVDAIELLDRVDNWRRRLDLGELDRRELSVGMASPGPIYTWLGRSQGLLSRKGYLVERTSNVFAY